MPGAVDLAKCTGARVTLLTVIQPAPWIPPVTNMPFAFSPIMHDEKVTAELVSAAKQDLANDKATLERQIPIVDTSVVVASSVPHAIIDCIESRDIDLVAMATHGRGASRFLLGSVADKIIRGSEVPVLLYHPDATALEDGTAEDEAAVTVGV
jgi:nucleotide-binding universal stress UspA family protein